MKILFTGGGTGGHVNPAIAVSKYIMERRPDAEICFIGTEKGIEASLVPREGFNLYTIKIHGLTRSFLPGKLLMNLKSIFEVFSSKKQALKILKEWLPDVVVGTGGYVSYPVLNAAAKLKIPTAILEVNALPGMTTKALARKADRLLISFEKTREYFKNIEKKIIVTGSPVREDVLFADKARSKEELGLSDKPIIVSFWGSMGAREMNKKIADFINIESKDDRYYHIHATGSFGYKWMPDYINNLGVDLNKHSNIILKEYIYDMARVMSAADIVICRAGASTLAEICALGKPSVIVPSPNVADNHQEKNARALEERGAAIVVLEKNCTGKTLYDIINSLLSDKKRLQKMGLNAQNMAILDSTERIYNAIMSMI